MKLSDILESINTLTMFHITPSRNLSSIMKYGLQPNNIKRGKFAADNEPAIYLFKTVEDAEDGVMNWLGDLYDETERLALLSVKVDSASIKQDPELELSAYITRTPIAPENITVLSKDI